MEFEWEDEEDGARTTTTIRNHPQSLSQQQNAVSRWRWGGCFFGMIILSVIVLVVIMEMHYPNAVQQFLETATTIEGSASSEQQQSQQGQQQEQQQAPQPPKIRRDNDRFIYVGVPNHDDENDERVPRQSETSMNALLDPPIAVPDPYGWMRDETRSNPEVLQHLETENNYTLLQIMQHLKPLETTLYEEMISYILETSHSFPILEQDFYYYQRTTKGQPYPLHCRAPKPKDNTTTQATTTTISSNMYLKHQLALWDGSSTMSVLPGEQVYLDESELAQDHDHLDVGSLEISPSQQLVAYTIDTTGNEVYMLVIQEIDTGKIVFQEDKKLMISNNVIWGPTDDTIFYTKLDDADRTYQVYQRGLKNTREEVLLYQEDAILFWVGMKKSKDNRYLLVETASSESSEWYYLDLQTRVQNSDRPDNRMALISVATRQPNVLYSVEHFHGTWWITSNRGGSPDLQLWAKPVDDENESKWSRIPDPKAVQPLLNGIAVEGLSIFVNHIVVQGRQNGMPQLWILTVDGSGDSSKVLDCQRLEWGVDIGTDNEGSNYVELASYLVEYNTTSIIVEYESLVTPRQHIEIVLDHPNDFTQRTVLQEVPVPGYQKELYDFKRIHVPSRDGKAQIPVSLVYLKSTMEQALGGSLVPIHLYGYGAYGDSIEDTFSSSRIPLLKRGMIYAIAHVRGGGEMGRPWYEDGKLLHKKNTFNDFIDVARYLIDETKWTTNNLLSCEGRSAGGLTIGASLNQSPELFRVAIMGVPFVDLVATMMDASIPLTAGEWEEWGNPNEEKFFPYMMDYSPMNNVQSSKVYPSILLLAGLYDPRVAFWEPAKMTATLRHEAISSDPKRPICLKTDMTSGHFSASDRYKYIEAKAFDYAFLLDQLGVSK